MTILSARCRSLDFHLVPILLITGEEITLATLMSEVNTVAKTLQTCLRNTASFAGMLFLLTSMALSACAIPVLLFALFWLG